MAQWFDERCLKLLEDLNGVPNNDEADELRLKLIRVAMRDSSLEMFRRAATNSRSILEAAGEDASNITIERVERSLIQDMVPEKSVEVEMFDLNNIPGVPEAMARAEQRFRPEKSNIADDVGAKPEEPVKSKPLSASDLNLSKFIKPAATQPEEANTAQIETDEKDDEPEQPSPEARIKINSSILRRRD